MKKVLMTVVALMALNGVAHADICDHSPYGTTEGNYKAVMLSFGEKLPGMEETMQKICIAKYHGGSGRRGLLNLNFKMEQITEGDVADLTVASIIRAAAIFGNRSPSEIRAMLKYDPFVEHGTSDRASPKAPDPVTKCLYIGRDGLCGQYEILGAPKK
jgi:hypothetical protein